MDTQDTKEKFQGRPFPHFSLKNSRGEIRENQDYEKKLTLFYFYPKDNTPGCTIQACDLRDAWHELRAFGLNVVGISPDGENSHLHFQEKFSLPFELLCDTNLALSQELGLWKEKQTFGKKYWGLERSSFLVENGKIIIWEKKAVIPKKHLSNLITFLKTHKSY